MLVFASIFIGAPWAQRVEVYFSHGAEPSFGLMPDGCYVRLDSLLASLIETAESSVDMCVYNFDATALPALSPAIRNAVARGVAFRLITDNCFSDEAEVIDSLDAWGIPHIDDTFGGGTGYMHCKFFVVDGRDDDTTNDVVVVTSSNLTENNLLRDANNTVVLFWHAIAKAFETQFNIFWGSESDEPDPSCSDFRNSFPDSIAHIFRGESIWAELYFAPFSPAGGYRDSVIKRFSSCQSQAFFCINVFSREVEVDETLRVLFEERGVDLRGVFGGLAATRTYSVYRDMTGTGDTAYNWDVHPPVYVDALPGGGDLHHKYLISDVENPGSDPFVLTGSMNWSANGFGRNNECVLVLHSLEVAQKFFSEFAARYIEAGGAIDEIHTRRRDPSPAPVVFPNPACWSITATPEVRLELFDLAGRFIGAFGTPTDLRDLPAGAYILRWRGTVRKLIVVR